jgi:hypothetical protein
MRTKTDTLILRAGFSLAVLVLAAFVALLAAVVVACVTVIGGPAGWATGLVLGLVLAQVLRGRTGALLGRLVA